ncbi:MAG: SDR family oxidoreductase [Sciscionella sp.]
MSAPVALVTGASSGIGLRVAVTLAHAGYRVYAGMRDPGCAGSLRQATATAPVPIEVVALDVTDHDAVTAAVATAGPVDVLVNNAGIGMVGSVELISEPDLRAVFDTNFFGPLALVRAVLPGMRERRHGVVINIGSVDAILPGRPMTWSYAASKHALGVATEGIALEVEPFGIRVRQIDPGFFATSIRENRRSREGAPADADGPYSQMHEATEAAVAGAVAAAGDPQQVADAVLHAVRDPTIFPVRRIVGADAVAAVTEVAGLEEAAAAAVWRNAIGINSQGGGT